MKVIFITREGYNLSGARVRCYNFARELGRHGIQAEVFSFGDHLGAKYGEKELEMSAVHKVWLGLKAFQRLFKEARGTIFIIQRMNYHAWAPLLVALLKKNKVIFDCDDWNIREKPIYHFGFYPSSKMEYVTRKVAGHAKACIAASTFLQSYLKQFNPRTHYLPTGVDTVLFSPQKKERASTITFSWIGTAYHKEMGENLSFLLSCFCALAGRHDNIFLSLVGEGKYFEETKKSVFRYKYKDKIAFHSWIPPDKVPNYLSTIDIGLLPLIQDTKFNRGKSPTKLFEYMSMAKPTISSNLGEAKNIIRERETGFLARNEDEFITCMRMLIENPDLRQSMGDKAREDVEKHYSLEVMGRNLAAIVRSI